MAVFSGNGSNSSPSFTFSSDTDTGIYRISDNTLGIAAGTGEIARFTTGGVGIGGIAPTQTLDVNGVTRSEGLLLADNDAIQATDATITKHSVIGLTLKGVAASSFDFSYYNPSNTALIVNQTGTDDISFPGGNVYVTNGNQVGINTTSPDASALLHVNGNSRLEYWYQPATTLVTFDRPKKISYLRPTYSADFEQRVLALGYRYTGTAINVSGFVGNIEFVRGANTSGIIVSNARVAVIGGYLNNYTYGNYVGLNQPRFVHFTYGGQTYNGIQLTSIPAFDILLDGWLYSNFTPFTVDSAAVGSLTNLGGLTSAN